MTVGRLEVKDLGRVGHADLELRPLTLIVGENNTGKSYLTSLLWGLLTLRWPVLDVPEAWATCDSLLEQVRRAGGERVVDAELGGLFERALNDALARRKAELVRAIFRTEAISAGALRAGGFLDEPATIRITTDATHDSLEIRKASGWQRGVRVPVGSELRGTPALILRDGICFGQMHRHDLDRLTSSRFDPVYLPAARTGLLLLYPQVLRTLLASLGDPGASPIQLTAPLIHHLGCLAASELREARLREEATALEEQLGGTIEPVLVQDLPIDYRWRLPSGGPLLPLAATSSMVTELAPLILVLRSASSIPWLILEEPEAHLHPRLQRKLAQVLVRLVKKGVRVVVTSHSATFCQQINHFIRAGALSEADRTVWLSQHGYEPTDYLGQDEVVGYELRADPAGGKTSTAKLPLTEQGIGMPSFNEPLEDLRRETISLMDAADGP